MITMDYIVQPNSNLRENFYEYLIANHYEALHFKKEEFVSLPYPFTINEKLKIFSLLKSISCCAMAATNNRILSVNEYMRKLIKN